MKMNLSNLEIRKLVIDSGVQYKDIAKKLGMSREWLSRCMRNQLSQAMEESIRIAIDELKSSAMESDLKRCPFCGGRAKYADYGAPDEFHDWGIECTICKIAMLSPSKDGEVATKAQAARAWNRRVADDSARTERA